LVFKLTKKIQRLKFNLPLEREEAQFRKSKPMTTKKLKMLN
jgi:hypothetical protein